MDLGLAEWPRSRCDLLERCLKSLSPRDNAEPLSTFCGCACICFCFYSRCPRLRGGLGQLYRALGGDLGRADLLGRGAGVREATVLGNRGRCLGLGDLLRKVLGKHREGPEAFRQETNKPETGSPDGGSSLKTDTRALRASASVVF